MSRQAETILEFVRLREIASCYSTCALGRRAVQALTQQHDVAALDAEFALVREAVRANIRASVRNLRKGSEILEQLVQDGSLTIFVAFARRRSRPCPVPPTERARRQ